jgi:hypothetical protein
MNATWWFETGHSVHGAKRPRVTLIAQSITRRRLIHKKSLAMQLLSMAKIPDLPYNPAPCYSLRSPTLETMYCLTRFCSSPPTPSISSGTCPSELV